LERIKKPYKAKNFYAKRDVEVLLGAGVSAEDHNENALGRALDILYDMDPDMLYPQIALHTVRQLKVLEGCEEQIGGLIPIHADTTSLSLTGEYPDQSQFEIVRGYSKDHCPDLKQMIFGLCTVRGLGLGANVDKGNQDDQNWNFEDIPRVLKVLDESPQEKSVYIADAAAITKENLELLAGEKIRFISRFPSNFTLCKNL